MAFGFTRVASSATSPLPIPALGACVTRIPCVLPAAAPTTTRTSPTPSFRPPMVSAAGIRSGRRAPDRRDRAPQARHPEFGSSLGVQANCRVPPHVAHTLSPALPTVGSTHGSQLSRLPARTGGAPINQRCAHLAIDAGPPRLRVLSARSVLMPTPPRHRRRTRTVKRVPPKPVPPPLSCSLFQSSVRALRPPPLLRFFWRRSGWTGAGHLRPLTGNLLIARCSLSRRWFIDVRAARLMLAAPDGAARWWAGDV